MPRKSFGLPESTRNRTFRGPGAHHSSDARPKQRGAYIPTNKFVQAATALAETKPYEATHRFVDFGLDERIVANLTRRGYEVPTPIQDQTIKPGIEGRDILGLANTGTGKTAAFLLPIIHRILGGQTSRALILAPTRELATQIDQEFRGFAQGLGLFDAICVGGTNINPQINALKRKPQIIIATPGRLKDLINNYGLTLRSCDTLVLDEFDRMLDMGFIRDIRYIIDQLPPERQSMFFSATLGDEIKQMVGTMQKDPITVSVVQGQTAAHIQQDVIRATSKDEKTAILAELLKKPEFEKVIIFGQTKYGVQRLSDKLQGEGFRVAAIHGNKSQGQRQRALDDFKANRTQALIATDVAARGLDIPNVSHVINYDQPNTYDDYVHRIGRTGRAGKTGIALTFVER
jgi:ATP-dependent RNA helicase RhlE